MSTKTPIDIGLQAVSPEDLQPLVNWMEDHKHIYTPFCDWLAHVIYWDLDRRFGKHRDPDPLICDVPDWDNITLACALQAVALLSHGAVGISETLGAVVDKLMIHVIATAAERLHDLPDPPRHAKDRN